MENQKKEKFEIRKDIFVAIINKLNDTQIKHVSSLLGVNPQACLEYLHHYKEDLNKISKENSLNDENLDWWNLYSDKCQKVIQHDSTTGFCRVVNTTIPSFPSLSFDELCNIVNIDHLSSEEKEKLKTKLISLFAQHLYKPLHEVIQKRKNSITAAEYWSYHDTVAVINRCFTKKKMMQAKGACYERIKMEKSGIYTKKEVLISDRKLLSPVYFDSEKGILYAYIIDPTIDPRDLDKLDICPIYINSICHAKIVNSQKLREPCNIIDMRRIKHNGSDKTDYFIDIFGDITVGNSKHYDIIIHLNHVAKAKLLNQSTLFTSYIKANKEACNIDFPFTLKMKVIRLEKLTDFIFTNSQHIKLDMGTKVVKEIEKHISNKIKVYQTQFGLDLGSLNNQKNK